MSIRNEEGETKAAAKNLVEAWREAEVPLASAEA
jgi:hypothetical protein